MLPGQSCDCSTAMASSAMTRFGIPVVVETCSMKKAISCEMSSRRSDSDGTRTGTTARRWNRSSRSVPSAMSGGEIARTRRDDAHVDVDAGQAADPLEILLYENAQDLALRFARHVGDFVEIERAVMGFFERADAASRAVPRLDAEQLDLHRIGRDGRGVDDDKGTVGARPRRRESSAPQAPCPSPARR